MKILLTNPTLHYSHGHKFLQPDWVSLTLPYIAAIAGKHEIKIVDNTSNKKYNLDKEIDNFNPDLVAFSIIAGRDVPSVIPELKKIKVKKIAGGQGASYNAKLLEDTGTIVFHDEAEKALPHYLETEELKKFDRINLDESPIPRWDLMPKTKSLTFNTYVGAMEMSRGCPFKCDFCAIADFWHSFRTKSNDRIIEELKYLSKLNMRHIYLSDDSFGINKNKHMELFDKILSNNIDIKFFTQIRADAVADNPEMIKMARRAGLYSVLVGFDSYDNDVLKENTKTTTVEINNEASRILRENKIAIVGSHIYGLPGQKSFEKTFKMGRKNSDVFSMPYFDGRPKIEKPGYDPVYVKYVKKNQFNISEILGAFFHPNKTIRVLKRGSLNRYINCSMGYEKNK